MREAGRFHLLCDLAVLGVRDVLRPAYRVATRNPTGLRGDRSAGGAFRRSFASFAEIAMRTRFKVLAAAIAVLAAGTSSAAMAKYPCAPGYRYHNRVCQPVRHLGYGNP